MPKQLTDIKPGDRFGKLTIIKCVGYPTCVKSKINYYLCQCDCGEKKEIRRNHLTAGKTISCGCIQRSHCKIEPGRASKNVLYSICRQSAKDRGIDFTLTKEQHENITAKPCYYCGAPPVMWNPRSWDTRCAIDLEHGNICISGIDRLDNGKGYEIDNCVPCCAADNRGKWEMTEAEFIHQCRKVVAFQDAKKNG